MGPVAYRGRFQNRRTNTWSAHPLSYDVRPRARALPPRLPKTAPRTRKTNAKSSGISTAWKYTQPVERVEQTFLAAASRRTFSPRESSHRLVSPRIRRGGKACATRAKTPPLSHKTNAMCSGIMRASQSTSLAPKARAEIYTGGREKQGIGF